MVDVKTIAWRCACWEIMREGPRHEFTTVAWKNQLPIHIIALEATPQWPKQFYLESISARCSHLPTLPYWSPVFRHRTLWGIDSSYPRPHCWATLFPVHLSQADLRALSKLRSNLVQTTERLWGRTVFPANMGKVSLAVNWKINTWQWQVLEPMTSTHEYKNQSHQKWSWSHFGFNWHEFC